MSEDTTQISLTPEVVETLYDLQQRGHASMHVDTLQKVLTGIIRDDMGDEKERLELLGSELLGSVLFLQDTLRCFILPEEKKGGAR